MNKGFLNSKDATDASKNKNTSDVTSKYKEDVSGGDGASTDLNNGAVVMLKSGFLGSGGGGDKEKMKKGSGSGDVVDRSTMETEFPSAASSLSNMVNSFGGNGGDEQTAPLPCDVHEHVPEQVKPVSLDSYANVTMDASKGVSLNEGGIEPAQYQSFQDFLDAKENHAKALPTSLP